MFLVLGLLLSTFVMRASLVVMLDFFFLLLRMRSAAAPPRMRDVVYVTGCGTTTNQGVHTPPHTSPFEINPLTAISKGPTDGPS